LAVVLLGFAALVYGLVERGLYQRTDRLLETERQEIGADLHLEAGGEPLLRHWIAEAKEHENLLCVVYDRAGQVIARTEEMAASSVPPAPPALPSGQQTLNNLTLPTLGRQRALTASLHGSSGDYTMLLLAPLEEVDHELDRLLKVLVLAVPVALALSGAAGYLLARKALAPVDRLRRSTEEISAAKLDRRLPVVNSHDELGRLAQTINAMITRLERSFAEIRRFTADASHELRTPLTAIRAEAELALSKPLGPEDCQQLAASVLEECERLTRLTEQLLTLAREDASLSPPVRVSLDLGTLVGDVVETMRPLAEAKAQQLHSRLLGSLRVEGDPARLRQVIINVLDNAIKYEPEGGTVAILSRRQDNAVVIEVEGGGAIPPEHLSRVFDRFYRVDRSRSRAEGGTGLGLSIAQSIVAAHGGSIELTSDPAKGTTCTMRVPVEPRPRTMENRTEPEVFNS
jgi:heavy metal sensor kinase